MNTIKTTVLNINLMEHINTEIIDGSKWLYSELILINSMKTYFETFLKLGKEYLYVGHAWL